MYYIPCNYAEFYPKHLVLTPNSIEQLKEKKLVICTCDKGFLGSIIFVIE